MNRQEAEQAFSELKAQVISGQQSFMEILLKPASQDYRAHVDAMRLATILMSDPDVLKAVLKEIDTKAMEDQLVRPQQNDVEKDVRRKDGVRRFEKLGTYHQEMQQELTPLLRGDFDKRLSKYLSLISSVEKRWFGAQSKYLAGDYPMACFTAILVIEEVGKLSRLWAELLACDGAPAKARKPIADKNHRRKHFLAVMSGALVNARLDRVLDKDVVRKILQKAESDELEKLRQSCLYIDFDGEEACPPDERIDEQTAKTYVVLAGELMAEVLGYFPWEWERMIESVIDFERTIGMPEKKIAGH